MSRKNIFFPLVFGILIIILAAIVSNFFYPLFNLTTKNEDKAQDRNYHILIAGHSDNLNFLTQVYEGAKKSADYYNAVVELYVSPSQAEDVSLANLLDYCSYVNADGILLYLDQGEKIQPQPYRLDGEEIPIVTLGNYIPDFPQVSFIGINWSEMGSKIGFEIRNLAEPDTRILIISSGSSSSPNYSTMMNSMQLYFKNTGISNYTVLDKTSEENRLEAYRFLSDYRTDNILIVCLTEEDTIFTSQTVSRNIENNNVTIIGFGENETSTMYMEKGIVKKLISLNRQQIGFTGITELFEYRNKGYANSYVPAEIRIRTKEK